METWVHDSISFGGSCVIMLSVLFSENILLQILAIVIIFFFFFLVTLQVIFPLTQRFLNGGLKYMLCVR